MGAECSVDRSVITEGKEQTKQIPKEETHVSQYGLFEFKSYKDYTQSLERFKVKLKEIILKYENINSFKLNQTNVLTRIENSYHSHTEDIRIEKLVEVAIFVYQKIGIVFGPQSFPKEELAKISYNMIASYLSYRYKDDDDSTIITQKIIKRINFFSEEFPFKLNKLHKIITSKKVYVFAYDINYRLNFYITPNISSTLIEYKDYILFMFFIIEHVLPLLQAKYNFSTQVNVTIDFGGFDVDTELIRFLIHYFDNIYPLGLGRISVINFEYENLKKNLSFRGDLEDLNYFKNLVFYEKSYRFQLIKEHYPNCLPIEYGGYHSMSSHEIKSDFVLDDFIEHIISMILIKCV